METICSKYYKGVDITEEEEEFLVDYLYDKGFDIETDTSLDEMCRLAVLTKYDLVEDFKKELKKDINVEGKIMQRQMIFDKDTYMKIASKADDETLLNMLAASEYKFDDSFFKKYLENNYPNTLRYYPYNKSYKQYYLDIVFSINKLKEDYDFEYSREAQYNPIEKYKSVERLKRANLPYDKYLYSEN